MRAVPTLPVLIFGIAIATARPQSSFDLPENREVIRLAYRVLLYNDTSTEDDEKKTAEATDALAAMGPMVDQVLAKAVVESLDPSNPYGRFSGPVNEGPPLTYNLPIVLANLRFAPAQVPTLLGPMAKLLNDVASGAVPPPGPQMAQQAALYVQRWGSAEQKNQMQVAVDKMVKSPDYDVRSRAKIIVEALANTKIHEIGLPKMSIYQYCRWRIERRPAEQKIKLQLDAMLHSRHNHSPVEAAKTGPPSTPAMATVPQLSREWCGVAVLSLIIGFVAAGTIWLGFRISRKLRRR